MSANEIRIGNQMVGDKHPIYFIAEIGINHNGDIAIAKKLIEVAASSDCNAVKFQKRTIDVVYTSDELAKPRENPFGPTNGDLKRGLEFGEGEYRQIDTFSREEEIAWFASCWDERSVDFMTPFNPPCYKIASASLTDDNLLKHTRAMGKPVLLSTGMSNVEQIDHAVDILGTKDLVIMHSTSTYPSKPAELNLRVIPWLKERYQVPIGYSGHEVGIMPSVTAAILGACVIERHITLDRAMWGSDQAASVEPPGIVRLVRYLRELPTVLGDGQKVVYETEKPIIQKLRRVGKDTPAQPAKVLSV